jgi:hypothetical protein
VLRVNIKKFGLATAGVAAGAMLAITPVFAQTSPTSPNSETLLASILAAAQAAGLNSEQTKELLSLAAEFSTPAPTQAPAAEVEDTDEDDTEVDDDAPAATGTAVVEKEHKTQTTTATVKAPETETEKD